MPHFVMKDGQENYNRETMCSTKSPTVELVHNIMRYAHCLLKVSMQNNDTRRHDANDGAHFYWQTSVYRSSRHCAISKTPLAKV